jgi:hypothetical protein
LLAGMHILGARAETPRGLFSSYVRVFMLVAGIYDVYVVQEHDTVPYTTRSEIEITCVNAGSWHLSPFAMAVRRRSYDARSLGFPGPAGAAN